MQVNCYSEAKVSDFWVLQFVFGLLCYAILKCVYPLLNETCFIILQYKTNALPTWQAQENLQ